MRANELLAWLAVILTWGPVSSIQQPKCVDSLRERGATKLDLPAPVHYTDADLACWDHGSMQLLDSVASLDAVGRTLCGEQLVPLGWPSGLVLGEDSSYDDGASPKTVPAGNLSSGERVKVGRKHMFDCVLCRHPDVTLPLRDVLGFDAIRQVTVHLTSIDPRDSAAVDEHEQAVLVHEVDELLRPLKRIKLGQSRLDDSGHLHLDFPAVATVVLEEGNTSLLNGSFVMSLEDVGGCPAGETVDADGVVTRWPATEQVDEFRFSSNFSTGVITRRDCRFNVETSHAEWDPLLTRWELVWRNCSSGEQYFSEEDYKQFLDAADIDRRHSNVLQESASTPVNTTTFQEVARLVNREVSARNALYEQTERYLVNITAHLAMDSGSDHAVATAGRADLIVADLDGSMPAVGFTIEPALINWEATDNVTVTRGRTAPVNGRALFAMDVSSRLAEAHSRMAFVVVWGPCEPPFKGSNQVEVTVMFPRQGEVSRWAFASYGNHHVDIKYNASEMVIQRGSFKYVCVAWSRDRRDWSKEGCKTLYVNYRDFSACRCSAKYFALQDGVPVAKYALQKGQADSHVVVNNIFTDFLKDKIALLTATAVEAVVSLFGLCSIICTAIMFKQWRENTGHKILLHMVLALTCNLALGFATNFMRMDTESVGCLVYGVLRHYSFLAMFFWMLTLSLLQLKRLMTVAGAKATTHLILKVSVFAWGVPMIPIIVLLAIDPGLYQNDRFERGYCYPEGLVFHLTVQAPAGSILFVNLVIFVNILLHIFECVGEKKITRHSKNEKAEQLNKLKTSVFIFFLFGFTWIFHLISEERVIVSDFLFEYLFLMTATTHISILALFFVVLQESTRKDWVQSIRRLSKKQ